MYSFNASISLERMTFLLFELSRISLISFANLVRYKEAVTWSLLTIYLLMELRQLKIKCGFIWARNACISTSAIFCCVLIKIICACFFSSSALALTILLAHKDAIVVRIDKCF